MYEEFVFWKVWMKNNVEKREMRIIGVDGVKIYNKLPKNESSFFKFLSFFRPNLKTKSPII